MLKFDGQDCLIKKINGYYQELVLQLRRSKEFCFSYYYSIDLQGEEREWFSFYLYNRFLDDYILNLAIAFKYKISQIS